MAKSKQSILKGYHSLEELGEFGLIGKIAELFGQNLPSNSTGIGDDCAVLPYNDTGKLLVTTDLLIENRHFYRNRTPAQDLAYKALAVNLSDISAMGGKPAYAFLNLALPADLPLDWLDDFLVETHKISEKYELQLMGGDTTRSDSDIFISYTLMGFAKKDRILLRSNAKPGDLVALLGVTGESGAGLNLLKNNDLSGNDKFQQLIETHNRPRLYMDEAQFLASCPDVHAMIDLSDGIMSDAAHIAHRSGATLRIDADKIPISPVLKKVCEEYKWEIMELVLSAGEDYNLLFTLNESKSDDLQNDFYEKFGYSFTIIGTVTEGDSELYLVSKDNSFKIEKTGHDHFKSH